MSIISVEEFKQKTGSGPSPQKKSYQNRVLHSGPVFSKTNKQLALSYCQDYLQKKRICFVVEEKHYLQIWYEEHSSTANTTNKLDLEKAVTTDKELWSEETSPPGKTHTVVSRQYNDDSSQVSQPSTVQNFDVQPKATVNPVFVDLCQQILIQLIGPIAPLLCQQTFAQNPHIEQSKFIELMAQQIPDAKRVTEFKQQLQKKLRQ